jgi:ERF superfamily
MVLMTAPATPATPATLAEALALVQCQLPRVAKAHTAKVTSQRTGSTHSYDYADLTDCTEAIMPLMSGLGLSFLAMPTCLGDMAEGPFVLAYTLRHVSGDHTDGAYPLPDPARTGPQDLGKAITYARRYALCAVTGLAPGGDDDDAQGQQDAKARPRTGTNAELRAEGRMDRAQKSAHERLEADTKRQSRRAERVRPPRGATLTDDDPWAQDAPVNGERAQAMRGTLSGPELTEAEDKPGSMAEPQHRAIERLLSEAGARGQGERHGLVMSLLDLPAMPPSPKTAQPSISGLSYNQAAELIRGLQDAQLSDHDA